MGRGGFPVGLASAECPDVDPGCVSVCVSLIHLLSRPVAVCLSACSLDDDADDDGDDNDNDTENVDAKDDGMNPIPDSVSVRTTLIHHCRLGAVHVVHVPNPYVFVLILQHVLSTSSL